MAGIKIDALSAEIAKMMEEYAAEAAGDVKAEAKAVAKEAVKELKTTSPEGPGSKKGHYKDGWASKVESENAVSIGIQVYNRKKPGLTHLLEKGHAKRSGGRVEGIQHIGPVEQRAVEEYEKRLKERLSR
ncbi:HK97 gp10 family phage protein [Clostridium sp. AF18-27]|uniref:HK97 gp10 family phage protein n=1 Tax=Enterocloster lavalensis TaxID=460384 RepID=UPI000E487C20|nr:HK97 gp10 family phage protein [Enterocloster lavalensis]RHR52107.1 HK97 gp10 family phage protein [Clostridium sp. AF18-27]